MCQVSNRVANTTLSMPADISSTNQYAVENALGLWWDDTVAITHPPGETNRLFIVDRLDGIYVVPDLDNPSSEMFLDLSGILNTGVENGLVGLAFHPNYQSNGYFYVFLTGPSVTSTNGNHDRLLRYSVSSTNYNRGNPASQVVLIEQYSEFENHNGGDLHFGPDGYLYLSLGDGGNYYGQVIDGDFFGGLLRIDVDHRPGSLPPNPHPGVSTNYAIPPDNPFVGYTTFNGELISTNSLREEFYAVGFRNPWRFTIDPVSGTIIVGDVGEGAVEEVNVIAPGGNYGWPHREGSAAFSEPWLPPEPPLFNPIDPVVERTHDNGNVSVIGGHVYHGSRLPELQGFYLFTDWATGVIEGFVPQGTNPAAPVVMAQANGFATVCFGTDPRNGDLLMSCYGAVCRLVRNADAGDPLPLTLADTGVFADLPNLTPHIGIERFEINVPFWSDYAVKTRWFTVPDLADTIGIGDSNPWTFPPGSVWIKHFEMEMVRGDPISRRRLETRMLVKTTNDVYGVTYRWQGNTNALLVGESGFQENLLIDIGGGTTVTQQYIYPSREQCRSCHTPEGGFALGFNTPQLNRARTYGSVVTNQIAALSAMGYFDTPVTSVNHLPALAPPDDTAVGLTYRARSYLQANCAQCHYFGGFSGWNADIHDPFDEANIVNGLLNQTLGDPANRVITPGDTAHSMMLTRISTSGSGRMPPIGSTVPDPTAIQLVSDWVAALTGYQDYRQWALAEMGSTNAPGTGPNENLDGDIASNLMEFLTDTAPTDPADFWTFDISVMGNTATVSFDREPEVAYLVEWSPDLVTWHSWDIAGNTPTFAATASSDQVSGPISPNTPMFFRMIVIGQ